MFQDLRKLLCIEANHFLEFFFLQCTKGKLLENVFQKCVFPIFLLLNIGQLSPISISVATPTRKFKLLLLTLLFMHAPLRNSNWMCVSVHVCDCFHFWLSNIWRNGNDMEGERVYNSSEQGLNPSSLSFLLLDQEMFVFAFKKYF